ncbi:Uncharacterized protein BM_BM481 [Brugia malayi]|uniref:Bm481 n=1 Tax=Brugia malayi TaxID=6279 RepID=A0A0K0JG98_BRUMA|nr:Uncharacterized protein BM_BM481 [Brugia malayi]CDP96256.1 Bm481 [Brugia malayi]VIO98479.1 Uncharacterized protein BM_BM481 [Brugia malayi]
MNIFHINSSGQQYVILFKQHNYNKEHKKSAGCAVPICVIGDK